MLIPPTQTHLSKNRCSTVVNFAFNMYVDTSSSILSIFADENHNRIEIPKIFIDHINISIELCTYTHI